MAARETSHFEITPMFSVPLVMAQMKACEDLNAQLTELFEQCEAEGDRYRNPDPFVYRNDKLYESRFDLFEWPHDCVRELRDFCMQCLYGTIGELNGYDTSMLRRLHVATESWFHITHQGGFFGAHNHALHSWSGVYCVEHAGDDPESNSGRLTFINPHAMSTMFIDNAVSNLKRPFTYTSRKLRLQPGQLVLFPSWLLHEVLPYEGDRKRITVAFNARFRTSAE